MCYLNDTRDQFISISSISCTDNKKSSWRERKKKPAYYLSPDKLYTEYYSMLRTQIWLIPTPWFLYIWSSSTALLYPLLSTSTASEETWRHGLLHSSGNYDIIDHLALFHCVNRDWRITWFNFFAVFQTCLCHIHTLGVSFASAHSIPFGIHSILLTNDDLCT